jgi:hypothetical protein
MMAIQRTPVCHVLRLPENVRVPAAKSGLQKLALLLQRCASPLLLLLHARALPGLTSVWKKFSDSGKIAGMFLSTESVGRGSLLLVC